MTDKQVELLNRVAAGLHKARMALWELIPTLPKGHLTLVAEDMAEEIKELADEGRAASASGKLCELYDGLNLGDHCDECNKRIPPQVASLVNDYHDEGCSLNSANVAG
jgi:hypothetical protein